VTPGTANLQWLVTQIGSREQYACPVSFARRGHLARFYTDLWWPYAPSQFARLPAPLWGLSLRHHSELPAHKVTAFTAATLLEELRWKAGAHRNIAEQFRHFIDAGSRFGARVVNHLSTLSLDPREHALFAFSTGALEPLLHARARGLFTVVDQLDPGHVDQEMVLEELARWPGWEPPHDRIPEEYFARLAKEWNAADLVLVNSEFSRRAMEKQGVPAGKLLVVPLCYETERPVAAKSVSPPGAPLRVLWLGQVVLRKGIPYLFEAARLLRNERIEFIVAGRIGISAQALTTAPANVRLLGKVNRDQALALYAGSDVFVLPTVSEGFAITQIEAMSFGLPVITTPNCGDVVTPERDGTIVPVRDPHALAGAILELHADRARLKSMAANALLKSRQFTLERYAETIEAAALRARSAPSPAA
jgi:glycosyltransferase involved in cell wall biosynthesis